MMKVALIPLVLLGCSSSKVGGVVTTVAGSSDEGYVDGAASDARFKKPGGLALDTHGTLYVADTFNHRIRMVASDGTVSTIAGNGMGLVDGVGDQAKFFEPKGLVFDGTNGLFVADMGNNAIRHVDLTSHEVTTVVGGVKGFADGGVSDAKFSQPFELALESPVSLLVADTFNHAIRRVDLTTRVVTTLAGSGTAGFTNGPTTGARFFMPVGLVIGPQGEIFVSEQGNNAIRKIVGTDVYTFAGPGETAPISSGYQEGCGADARFTYAGMLAFVSEQLIIADGGNNVLRKVGTDGCTNLMVGVPSPTPQKPGSNGASGDARLVGPASPQAGTDGSVYFLDDSRVRLFAP